MEEIEINKRIWLSVIKEYYNKEEFEFTTYYAGTLDNEDKGEKRIVKFEDLKDSEIELLIGNIKLDLKEEIETTCIYKYEGEVLVDKIFTAKWKILFRKHKYLIKTLLN